MSVPLLEIRNLETYYGPVMAIRGVSLTVAEGAPVVLTGAVTSHLPKRYRHRLVLFPAIVKSDRRSG